MEKMYRKFFDELRGKYYWQRISDNACIPLVAENRDYQQFLRDLEENGEEIVIDVNE